MARKKRHEKEPNHERWLVSYADFITLLFAFFVTMYSISQVDAHKFQVAVQSIHQALGSVVPMNTPCGAPGFFNDANNKPPELDNDPLMAIEPALKRLLKGMQSDPALQNVSKGVRVTNSERGLIISFPDTGLFAPCSVELRQEGKPVLDALGEAMLKMSSPVRVEGHTDPHPCSAWPSNWELSTARACAVIRYLTQHFNFNPARLSAAGYASYRPVDTNDSEEGRSRNRRVDIVILNERMKVQEPGGGLRAKIAPPISTSVRK
jgi:chemotaxis protein MotB